MEVPLTEAAVVSGCDTAAAAATHAARSTAPSSNKPPSPEAAPLDARLDDSAELATADTQRAPASQEDGDPRTPATLAHPPPPHAAAPPAPGGTLDIPPASVQGQERVRTHPTTPAEANAEGGIGVGDELIAEPDGLMSLGGTLASPDPILRPPAPDVNVATPRQLPPRSTVVSSRDALHDNPLARRQAKEAAGDFRRGVRLRTLRVIHRRLDALALSCQPNLLCVCPCVCV